MPPVDSRRTSAHIDLAIQAGKSTGVLVVGRQRSQQVGDRLLSRRAQRIADQGRDGRPH